MMGEFLNRQKGKKTIEKKKKKGEVGGGASCRDKWNGGRS
jgi:hypothetical protein